jgi:amino acid permease
MSCLCYVLLGVLYHIGREEVASPVIVSHTLASVRTFKPGLGIVLAVNLQLMAFMCHPSLPILYAELRPDSKHHMVYIIQSSTTFALVFYLLMAVGHFYVQNGHPSGNLLADYAPNDAMMNLAKCILSMVLILKAPLVYRPLHSLIYSTLSLSPPSQIVGVLECFGTFICLVVLTLLVPDLVTVMSWSGLTCGALIGFILPGLMLIVDAKKEEPLDDGSPGWTRGTKGRLVGAGILATGLFISIFGPFTIGFIAD